MTVEAKTATQADCDELSGIINRKFEALGLAHCISIRKNLDDYFDGEAWLPEFCIRLYRDIRYQPQDQRTLDISTCNITFKPQKLNVAELGCMSSLFSEVQLEVSVSWAENAIGIRLEYHWSYAEYGSNGHSATHRLLREAGEEFNEASWVI